MKRIAALACCILAGCATARKPVVAPVTATTAPPGMQYLYGSGESAALSEQSWRDLSDFVAAAVRSRPAQSVMLTKHATLDRPSYVSCASKPLAVVVDVDETVVLNRGFERDAALGTTFSPTRWQAYERTGGATAQAVPGAVKAMEALRQQGVTVIFNTNRSAANAGASEAMLNRLRARPKIELSDFSGLCFTGGLRRPRGSHGLDQNRSPRA